LSHKPTAHDPATLTLHVAGDETSYLLACLPSDFGEGFRLSKLMDEGDGPAPIGEVYDVLLNDRYHGWHYSCECLGFLRHGHCKHGDSLTELRKAGRI
jgi:hypothetical protein